MRQRESRTSACRDVDTDRLGRAQPYLQWLATRFQSTVRSTSRSLEPDRHVVAATVSLRHGPELFAPPLAGPTTVVLVTCIQCFHSVGVVLRSLFELTPAKLNIFHRDATPESSPPPIPRTVSLNNSSCLRNSGM
jgi:hypothetical protein